jgi:hypothetical protein
MRKLILTLLTVSILLSLHGQEQKIKRKEWRYIPSDLNDAIQRLDFLLDTKSKDNYKGMVESKAVKYVNLGSLGMTIRNDWRLWKKSRLFFYFDSLGINYPMEMTNIIFTSYHRHLNNKPIDLDRQIIAIKDFHKNPNKYIKKPVERFSIGDTVFRNEFEPVGFPRDILGLYGNYELIATVIEKDFENDKIKIKIIDIKKSEPDIKLEDEHFIDAEIWYNATWWRKEGEITHIFITPSGTSTQIIEE